MLVTLLLFELFCEKLQHVFRNLFYLHATLFEKKRVFTVLLRVEISVFSVAALVVKRYGNQALITELLLPD